MKLKLKHLAPYLEHRIKAKNCFNEIVEVKGVQFGNESCNNILWTFVKNGEYLQGYLYQCKPILRPLCDLTKEIEHNGEKLVPIEFLAGRYNSECGEFLYRFKNNLSNIEDAPYTIINKILEWHFDIFGLIENGLAVDINNL